MKILLLQFTAAEESVLDKLGLGLGEIIFHAISLLILVVFMWLLLYKPIKKIIDERKQKIKDVFDNNQKLQQEASDTKEEYQRMLQQAKEEAVVVANEATAKAQEKAKQIIDDAHNQSIAIVSVAHKETQIERTQMQNEFKEQVADIIIDLATKVIEREVQTQDHTKFIQEALQSWEN